MSASIVRQLVWKDLQIMKLPIALYWLGGIACIAVAVFGPPGVSLASFILFISAIAGAGIHCMFQTVVEERREQTLAFIMSLPITVREYTSAKLIANLAIIVSVWATLSGASFVVFIGDDGLPDGMIPFATIVFVGIFLALIIMLATSIVLESIAYSIGAIVAGNLLTQIFLWWVSDLYGIRSVMGGPVAVWNATAFSVLAGQVAAIGLLIALTYTLQARKTDFI